MPLPLLAALILMLLLASICVFAAVTFIQYLSKNWSWACCSWFAEPEWWEGGGALPVGEGGCWVGVVDDQHRSKNFEKSLHFSSCQTGRQTALTTGEYWSAFQEVLESPGTNARHMFIYFLLFSQKQMSNSSTQPHPWAIQEDLKKTKKQQNIQRL